MSPKLSDLLLPPLVLFLSFNILILNLVVFSRQPAAASVTIESVSPTPEPTAVIVPSVPPSASPTPTLRPSATATPRVPEPIREVYIPLGTGTVLSSEWTGLPATDVTINTAHYPPIAQAYFEVFMHIPTGNGQMMAKLYNETDRHDVWFSEVAMTGSQIVRREVPVTLEPGNKRYRVMLKSTLRYDAVLDNARIRLTFK